MKMYFHFGDSEIILFKEWTTNDVGGIVGSAIGIFFMAIFYECLKSFREYLFELNLKTEPQKQIALKSSAESVTVLSIEQTRLICTWLHFVQTFLHMIQITVSYFLMLIVMTYNGWLFIAVILGAGVGYFVSAGWKKRSSITDRNECCN